MRGKGAAVAASFLLYTGEVKKMGAPPARTALLGKENAGAWGAPESETRRPRKLFSFNALQTGQDSQPLMVPWGTPEGG